mgnify:CR=1 FL=1
MYLNNVFEHCELHVQQIIQQQNHCINKLKKEKHFFLQIWIKLTINIKNNILNIIHFSTLHLKTFYFVLSNLKKYKHCIQSKH